MLAAIAAVPGIKLTELPKNAELDRLFKAKLADTGAAWPYRMLKVSTYDLITAPHKSVPLGRRVRFNAHGKRAHP